MLEDIKSYRKKFISNLQKSFNFDLSKGVAAIGEIRHWNDGDYKKVGNGEWVKVTDKKDKRVAGSTMIKNIKLAIDYNQMKIDEFKKDFEDNFISKHAKGSLDYQMLFNNAWQNEIDKNKFIDNIYKEQRDFRAEIREIEDKIKIDKKLKREVLSGKKEIDSDDLESILRENQDLLLMVNKNIPQTGTAKDIIPEVTIDDYYLDTSVKFESILSKEDDYKAVDKKWIAMKNSNKYDWHKSPKSSSEYLIDKKTGDIFRFADHWGRVASCDWRIVVNCDWIIDNEITDIFDIAKANIKDFSRKDSGIYFNPKFRDAMVKSAKIVLSNMKKLVSDNKEFYLTNRAKKNVGEFVDDVFKKLQRSADLSIKEIDKLKKKYEFI